MLRSFWFRTLAYIKALFTDDPNEEQVIRIIANLENVYERRAATLELENTYLRDRLEDSRKELTNLYKEVNQFLAAQLGETKVNIAPEVLNYPNPVARSRGWMDQKLKAENKLRRPVNQAIQNIEDELFDEGSVDARNLQSDI